MKKYSFSSLKQFYANVTNDVRSDWFERKRIEERPDFYGLSIPEIIASKFSYPTGVEMLKDFADIEIQKPVKVKFWNQYDGYDINVDRMFDNLDFLLDTRKVRKLPKTIDIYINITESWRVPYSEMLCKTYAAIKVIDRLETLGVRCAVFACASGNVHKKGKKRSDDLCVIEVCIKQYSDPVNLGAICTAISPWMFRYWMLNFILGKYKNVGDGITTVESLPQDEIIGAIVIDRRQCTTISEANHFIETIKVA